MTLIGNQATHDELTWFDHHARAPRLRGIREFVEQELVLPEGPYRDLLFRCDRQPISRLWFNAIDSGQFRRFACLFCVQGGKSVYGFVAPAMWHLFEWRENVIIAAPTLQLAAAKWRLEILPAIRASRYADLLPSTGRGSKGGVANEIELRNGCWVIFLGAGGGDEQRSSYTSRVVVATEVDKMDVAGEVSRETDPISQLEARTYSYPEDQRRLYLECTVSIEEGRIWQEWLNGTKSRVAVECYGCHEWITPEREHLAGWQDATTNRQAREEACWACPSCGVVIDEEQRHAMNAEAILLHDGQSADADRTIHGDPPDTDTLAFRGNAFNNVLSWSTAEIAASEWQAKRARDEESAEKRQLQFRWTKPYVPPNFDIVPLDHKAVAERKAGWPQGVLPADTRYLTLGVDPGKWHTWWLALAFRSNGQLHVPDYGVIDTHSDDMPEKKAILLALRELRDRIDQGWQVDGQGQPRLPDRVLIDSGHLPESVFAFASESGTWPNNRYLPSLGRGASQMEKRRYTSPQAKTTTVRTIGDHWHVARVPKYRAWQITADADHWKVQLQGALALAPEKPGALSLFTAPGLRHNKLSRHLTSEKLVREFVPGKGEMQTWKKSGANHWLDCAYEAMVAGSLCGFTQIAPEVAASGGTVAGGPQQVVANGASWKGKR